MYLSRGRSSLSQGAFSYFSCHYQTNLSPLRASPLQLQNTSTTRTLVSAQLQHVKMATPIHPRHGAPHSLHEVSTCLDVCWCFSVQALTKEMPSPFYGIQVRATFREILEQFEADLPDHLPRCCCPQTPLMVLDKNRTTRMPMWKTPSDPFCGMLA